VTHLVYSHHHADHGAASSLFGDVVRIGHEETRRLLLRDDRLVGAILLGDLRDARALREHLATGTRVPEALLSPMPAGAQTPPTHDDPAATVCSCMAVSQREIVTAIDTLGLENVEEVAAHTRAGTGCGTCRGDLAAVLAARRRHVAELVSTPA